MVRITSRRKYNKRKYTSTIKTTGGKGIQADTFTKIGSDRIVGKYYHNTYLFAGQHLGWTLTGDWKWWIDKVVCIIEQTDLWLNSHHKTQKTPVILGCRTSKITKWPSPRTVVDHQEECCKADWSRHRGDRTADVPRLYLNILIFVTPGNFLHESRLELTVNCYQLLHQVQYPLSHTLTYHVCQVWQKYSCLEYNNIELGIWSGKRMGWIAPPIR